MAQRDKSPTDPSGIDRETDGGSIRETTVEAGKVVSAPPPAPRLEMTLREYVAHVEWTAGRLHDTPAPRGRAPPARLGDPKSWLDLVVSCRQRTPPPPCPGGYARSPERAPTGPRPCPSHGRPLSRKAPPAAIAQARAPRRRRAKANPQLVPNRPSRPPPPPVGVPILRPQSFAQRWVSHPSAPVGVPILRRVGVPILRLL